MKRLMLVSLAGLASAIVHAETWTWVGGSSWGYSGGKMVEGSGTPDWRDGYNWEDSNGQRGTMWPDLTRVPCAGDTLIFTAYGAHVYPPNAGGAYKEVRYTGWAAGLSGPYVPIQAGGKVIMSTMSGNISNISLSSDGDIEISTPGSTMSAKAHLNIPHEITKTGTGELALYQGESYEQLGSFRLQEGSIRSQVYDAATYPDPFAILADAFVFDGANVFLNLNGNNSRMTACLEETANATGHYIISAAAARLTLEGEQPNTVFSGDFRGAVSLCWAPDTVNDDYGTLELRSAASDTTGTLTVSNGIVVFTANVLPFPTLSLAEGAAVRASGIMSVGSGVLTVADAAVADGVYCSAARETPRLGATAVDWIVGDGLVVVGTIVEPTTVGANWTKTGYMSDPDNWNGASSLPPLADGSVLMQVTGGESATVDGDYWLKGIDLGVTGFSLLGSKLLRLGSLGLTTPGNGSTYEITAPVAPVASQTWTVGAGDKLRIKGSLQTVNGGTLTIRHVQNDGNSTVEYRASSPDFMNDIVIKDGMSNWVYADNALGGPGGTTTFDCTYSPKFFGCTQTRPIVFKYSINFDKNPNVKNVFLGKVHVCAAEDASVGIGARRGTVVFGAGVDIGHANNVNDYDTNGNEGGCVIVSNGVLRTLGRDRFSLSSGELHLYSSSNEINIVQMGYIRGEGTTLYTHAPNAIYASRLNFGGNQAGGSVWDLGGFDQTVKYLQCGRGSSLSSNNPPTIRSAAPAMLHLEDEANIYSPGTSSTSSATNWACFVGMAGFSKDGPFRDHSLVQTSSTTGTVQVTKGTLYFRKNCIYNGVDYGDRGSWPNASLAVAKGTGTLVFEHSRSIGRKTDVEIADDGKIQIDEGVVQRCRSLTIGGEKQREGTWGSSMSSADNKSAAFAGTGVLYACRNSGMQVIVR